MNRPWKGGRKKEEGKGMLAPLFLFPFSLFVVPSSFFLVSALLVVVTCTTIGCDREERQFRVAPPYAARSNTIVMSDNQAGQKITVPATYLPYDHNAYAISEGQRLFNWMNCVGCHANGGGGMGPPLMDDKWIYGSDPANIFATILEGRPNGMPSFRGKLNDQQVWQLVAYIRSLSTLTRRDAMTSRTDHMMATPEASMQSKDNVHSRRRHVRAHDRYPRVQTGPH